MKTNLKLTTLCVLSFATCLSAFAQGTAFTYQGRLNDGASSANGRYDLKFAIYDSLSGGTQQGNLLTNSTTAVSNGLFTVVLDFGNQFPGANRWLEISVRTNGAPTFFTLTPRQALTPTPYAITAGGVLSGGLAAGTYGNAVTLNNSANQISGSFAGNGANVTNVNAVTLNGISSGGFWKTNGNAGANPANGAYLGTADNLPLEFKVNGQRAMRLEYAFDTDYSSVAPNLIGGSAGNIVSNGFAGGFIGGGGNDSYPNRVGGSYASVLGGLGNLADGYSATAMGASTTASGNGSTAMGLSTTASGYASTAMGTGTTAGGYLATAMGEGTTASGNVSTAVGIYTTASGSVSTAMGYNSIASGNYSTALGQGSVASGLDSVSAGLNNVASGINSVAMGETCQATNLAATALGYHNIAGAPGSMALGVFSRALHNNSFVWSDGSPTSAFASSAANQFLIYAGGGVGINTTNPLGDAFCVSGDARIDAQPAAWNEGLAINCPTNMTANGGFGGIHFHSTGPGQGFSPASIKWSEMYNYAPEIGNAVGGGLAFIRNNSSTVLYLSASNNVGIGTASPTSQLHVKSASADCQISLQSGDSGGHQWAIDSSGSGASGRSPAGLETSFQIIDRTPGVSYFQINTNGNVGIGVGSGVPSNKLQVGGGITCTTLTQTSDRNAKENFQPVDAQEVLSKVASLPVSRWNYKEDKKQAHLGPMAQDFYAAFNVGPDDKHITTIDESGVALAAIQGLNQKLEETRAENAGLKRQNDLLSQRLNELENTVKLLVEKK